jgi:hypothetical protein
MFKFYPQQRNTVVDEFVQGVLTHLSPGKHLPRHFPLQVRGPRGPKNECRRAWFTWVASGPRGAGVGRRRHLELRPPRLKLESD